MRDDLGMQLRPEVVFVSDVAAQAFTLGAEKIRGRRAVAIRARSAPYDVRALVTAGLRGGAEGAENCSSDRAAWRGGVSLAIHTPRVLGVSIEARVAPRSCWVLSAPSMR